MRTIILILLTTSLFSCTSSEDHCRESATLEKKLTLNYQRTEGELFGAKGPEQVRDYLKKYPAIAEYFFYSKRYPNDSLLVEQLWQTVSNQSADTVYQEAVSTFADISVLKGELNEGFTRLKNFYPQAGLPQVFTTVTGLYNDLFVSDSVIIIGLDHFIGQHATYKPNDIPNYILERYNKEHLSAIIMQFISANFVRAGEQNSLLSDMIDYGKTYYLTGQLMPCTPDSILFGYTAREVAGINVNRERIWAHFIENELLYETEHFQKKKYIGDRPNVYEIGDECPGRIATWLGYEIVQSYMRSNEVSVKAMIEMTDHHLLFERSGYQPKNRRP